MGGTFTPTRRRSPKSDMGSWYADLKFGVGFGGGVCEGGMKMRWRSLDVLSEKKIAPDGWSQGDDYVTRLLERFNTVQGQVLRCKFPQLEKFILMQRRPFDNHPKDARRQVSCYDDVRANVYLCFVIAVLGMKMRRDMIAKEHLDADAKEAADFRHEKVLEVLAKRLRVSCL